MVNIRVGIMGIKGRVRRSEGADDQEGEADEQQAKVDDLGLDVFFVEHEHSVEK